MKYEWDNEKNILNKQKHNISFEEAIEVFDDPLQISKLDKRFSYFEERWITVGATSKHKILVIAHLFFTSDGEEVMRIISARKANNQERSNYENY